MYKAGQNDQLVYIILFGKLIVKSEPQQNEESVTIGRINLGWTVGEEILFDRTMQIRKENVVAETDSCLVAISKQNLAIL